MTGTAGSPPDFIVLGGQRCGSTWTQECLMSHPDVYVPRRRRGVTFDEDQIAHYDGEGITGIVNSTLLTDPGGPALIAEVGGSVRLVAILRNPIDRAYSWYLKRLRDGDDIYAAQPSFTEALEADASLIDGGLYYPAVSRYLEAFGPHRLLVLDYADLAQDAAGFISRIYGFVGAASDFEPPQLAGRSNYSAAVRSGVLHQAMRRGKRALWKVSGENGPFISRLESSAMVGRLRKLNEQKTTTMPSETRAALTARFAAPNEDLSGLLGWDLSHWV